MREFFDRLNLRIAEFMNGRNGLDNLNKFMLVLAILLMLFFAFVPFLSTVAWIILALVVFRSFSVNILARERENEKYLQIVDKPLKVFKRLNLKWTNRKTTVYFKCKNCGTHLSLPKGKGKLRVVCPKCKTEIFKRT